MYAYFFPDFLHFVMSLLLLTVTLRGLSNKHCLLPLFSFYQLIYVLLKQFGIDFSQSHHLKRVLGEYFMFTQVAILLLLYW